jgi:hypothetical protein
MTPENEMNEEVRQLLDSLEEHGKNARRQKELGDLIDQLSEKELGTGTSLRGGTTKQSRREATSQSDASTSDETSSLDCFVPRNDAKRHKLTPLWWAMGAAAACLLLWLLVKPNAKPQPEMEQEILVEETKTNDSVKTEVNDAVIEQPVANEALLAEETPVVPQNASMKKEKPKTQIIEEVVEQPMLAEVKPTKTKDTTNIGSNTIPTENETPSAVQKPQRRVIRSLNLVCYECQKDPEFFTKPVLEDRTLFGQPQDPNMKNGSLALEIKLN